MLVGSSRNEGMTELIMAQIPPESRLVREGTLSVRLDGRVDLMTVPGIRKKLLGFAKKREIKEIRLDLSDVTLLDTSGVAMLVELWRCLSRKSGALHLTGVRGSVRRLIQMARLDQVFKIGEDPGREDEPDRRIRV